MILEYLSLKSTPIQLVLLLHGWPDLISFKACSHLMSAFAFASTSPSPFNIASMVTQTQTHIVGLNPFSASVLIWRGRWRKRKSRRQVWTKHRRRANGSERNSLFYLWSFLWIETVFLWNKLNSLRCRNTVFFFRLILRGVWEYDLPASTFKAVWRKWSPNPVLIWDNSPYQYRKYGVILSFNGPGHARMNKFNVQFAAWKQHKVLHRF